MVVPLPIVLPPFPRMRMSQESYTLVVTLVLHRKSGFCKARTADFDRIVSVYTSAGRGPGGIGLAIANGQKPTVCGDRQFSSASSSRDDALDHQNALISV